MGGVAGAKRAVSGSHAKLCLHICNANTGELTGIGAAKIKAAAQLKPLHGIGLRAAGAAACFRTKASVGLARPICRIDRTV
jgi:L-serine deaminase